MLELGFANMQLVDLYTPLPAGDGFAVKQSGSMRPVSTWDVLYPHIVLELEIPSGSQQIVYLRLQSGASMTLAVGAIISAATYQLILAPLLEVQGSAYIVGLGLAAGALTFYLADRWIDNMGGADRMKMHGGEGGGSGTGILLGSLLDGVPESLVLGLSRVHSPQVSLAFVFAVAIGNVPQGLGGTAGMLRNGWERGKITRLWLAVCALSIVAAALGYALAA